MRGVTPIHDVDGVDQNEDGHDSRVDCRGQGSITDIVVQETRRPTGTQVIHACFLDASFPKKI